MPLRTKFSYDSSCSQVKKKKVGNTWGDIFSIVQRTNLCPGVDMMIPSSMILNTDDN